MNEKQDEEYIKEVRRINKKATMHSSWKEELNAESEKANDKQEQEIKKIQLNQLKGFKDHPFKIEINTELFELMQSIENDGILVPLLARPSPGGNGYELISGHRRKAACEWAGINEVPVMICNLDDNQATIAMVNSNLHREHIKPSEKAFAYKMRLEAMKRQGERSDLTLSQLGTKLEIDHPNLEANKLALTYDWHGGSIQNQSKNMKEANIRSDNLLAKQVGESRNQIARYIRLTNLIPKLLDMVDEGKIAFTVAVELSYLKEEEQYELHAVMDLEQCTPSLSQANRLKRMSQSDKLNMDAIYEILDEEKPNQKLQIKIKAETLEPYFPCDFTERQKVELIKDLVKEWHSRQTEKRAR
ncbi:ParB/RepB/Spo0J family partition protein [Anaerobium acetethylicum]|uniref:Chromosome partitioning protein, ParB family n=1 Tax=Anaerobium acetethylicum TaxID=1619234 RepID=A0A1D3TYX7_9FIRM|nr:ParB/RepB/Spo0J family partition protein [Anaerobium acetethylicum]SCP99697.1 chromosome partitioning protein, ParB family [Anaerobium acetethylicum]